MQNCKISKEVHPLPEMPREEFEPQSFHRWKLFFSARTMESLSLLARCRAHTMSFLSTAYLTFRAISSTFRMGGQGWEIPSVLFPLIDKCALTWADQSLHWRGESSLYNNVFGHHQAGHLCLGQDQACHLSRWPGQVHQPLLVASPAHPASHGIGFDQQVFDMKKTHPWSSFACFFKRR